MRLISLLQALVFTVMGLHASADLQEGLPPLIGEYELEGQYPDGSGYSGMMVIKAMNEKRHAIMWQRAGQTQFGTAYRIGVNGLVAAYGNKLCSVAAYTISKSELDGIWFGHDAEGFGREKASGKRAGKLKGKLNVSGANMDGEGAYEGTLRIKKRGDLYQFRWNVGSEYEGVGVRQGDNIAVGWGAGPDDGCAYVLYEISPEGLDGIWGAHGLMARGTEFAKRK